MVRSAAEAARGPRSRRARRSAARCGNGPSSGCSTCARRASSRGASPVRGVVPARPPGGRGARPAAPALGAPGGLRGRRARTPPPRSAGSGAWATTTCRCWMAGWPAGWPGAGSCSGTSTRRARRSGSWSRPRRVPRPSPPGNSARCSAAALTWSSWTPGGSRSTTTMSIPTATSVPGAELVLRAGALAPDPSTVVVVNCAGRTRSIIGTQSLINAGLPNRVLALRNGTIGWSLAGLDLDHGQDRRGPEVSPRGRWPGGRRRRPGPWPGRRGWAGSAPAGLAVVGGAREADHLPVRRPLPRGVRGRATWPGSDPPRAASWCRRPTGSPRSAGRWWCSRTTAAAGPR